MRRTTRKLAASGAIICALVALLAAVPTFSAFSGSTSDAGNSLASGTVTLGDNDGGTAMFAASGLTPGASERACIQVTSTGTRPSLVRLYGTTGGTGLAAYMNLVVTRGTVSSGSFDDCTGFSSDSTDHIG